MARSGKALVCFSRLNRSSSTKATGTPSWTRAAAVSCEKQLIPRMFTRALSYQSCFADNRPEPPARRTDGNPSGGGSDHAQELEGSPSRRRGAGRAGGRYHHDELRGHQGEE